MSDEHDWLNEPYLSPSERMTVTAIEWLLPILFNARERPAMYFRPIGPTALIHWLHGIHTGLSLWSVNWSDDHRKPAVERRGLEHRACWNEEDLEKRGLSPADILYELLSIEIEMWMSHRDEILRDAASRNILLRRPDYPS